LVVGPSLENTKEVAAGVGHDNPSLVSGRPDVRTRGPELLGLIHTGRLIFRPEIQVDSEGISSLLSGHDYGTSYALGF
jgi:hypothetical protein